MTDDFEFDPREQELRRRFGTLDTAPDGETEWRIRVDLVNGQLEAETTQH